MATRGINMSGIGLILLILLGVALVVVLPWAIRAIGDTLDELRNEKSKDRPED